MRRRVLLRWVAVCIAIALLPSAWAAEVKPEDLENVFKTLVHPSAAEAPRVLQTDEGFLHYLGAPAGGSYHALTPPAKNQSPEAAARNFFSDHGGAFGVTSDCVTFRTHRINSAARRSYVKLQQTYSGLDVFCAQVTIQVEDGGGVNSVLSDILRNTEALDSGAVSTTPDVTADNARAAAIAEIAVQSAAHEAEELTATGAPVLMIYDPAVVGLSGSVRLVWQVIVTCPDDPLLRERVLVDAHSGEVPLHFNTVPNAKNREIYDSDNTYADPGVLMRAEGQPPSGIQDVDLGYDCYGDTYDFYFTNHDRDSIDGFGMTMSATVRFCSYYLGCPMQNAFWSGTRMYFGTGWVSDDVVAHELTHGVTDYESALIYLGESGAINESFSDIWGEFVDLTNGRGTDTPEVRWYIGEDSPSEAFRNMANPPEFGDPDRTGSPYWVPPEWWWLDNGGVHYNSGVGNKLCYLLTDGDFFNGYTIAPLADNSDESISRVADLFYDLQANLLNPASDYHDLFVQLAQATINQGYSFTERMNVRNAGYAVEINPPEEIGVRFLRATPVSMTGGDPAIAVTWKNPNMVSFRSVTLVRNSDSFPENPSDGVTLYQGAEENFLDTNVEKDVSYFYSLFADFRQGFPQVLYAYADGGADPADPLTEAFEIDLYEYLPDIPDVSQFVDLTGCQLTFTPVGSPVFPSSSNLYYTDYNRYEATVTKGHFAFPVAREDAYGGAYSIPMRDEWATWWYFWAPFPFFGGRYNEFYISSNGFVSFEYVMPWTEESFPSIESHFAVQRISFLFADLNPSAGGDIWLRYLDDRVAVTFEYVPEWLPFSDVFPQSPWSSSVQLEMFYSGTVRITYLDLGVMNAVCGLSDGRGVPIVAADIFPNVDRVEIKTDLSELPEAGTRLSIQPIPYQNEWAGDTVQFDVSTNPPNAGAVLTAEWDVPGAVPFVDNSDGTGRFEWNSPLDLQGEYRVRIHARAGTEEAFQDVTLYLSRPDVRPEARNVLLRSENPMEDPSANRTVDSDSSLTAEYTYYHPLESDASGEYGQSIPLVYWFRNEVLVPAFTNHFVVPASVTEAGEEWFFAVIPRTLYGVRGEEVLSPIVAIVAFPSISSVAPTSGPAAGGTTLTLTGERLDRPVSVIFGGIAGLNLRSISDTEVQVDTPAHAAGTVDILLTTIEGTALVAGGFAYVEGGARIVKADLNHDGVVDAQDVQLCIMAVLGRSSKTLDADANLDGAVNSLDIQAVVNLVLNPGN